jgi:hypothetical protein
MVVTDGMAGIYSACSSWTTKAEIPPLSAGNFVNQLFDQGYPQVLTGLNTADCFIARVHVVDTPLKLTSGA